MILNKYIKEYNLKIKNNKNINDLNIILRKEKNKDIKNEKNRESLISLILFFVFSTLFSYHYLGNLHQNSQYSEILYLFGVLFVVSFFISFISNKNIYQNLTSAFFISFIPIIPYSYYLTFFSIYVLIFVLIKKNYIKKTKTKIIKEEIELYNNKIENNDYKMESLIGSISTDPDSLYFLENSEYKDFNKNVKKEIHNYLINHKKSSLVDNYIKQHSATSIYND